MAFSTYDALTTLCQSIPDWTTRLDEQIAQISLRQIELARLDEADRPPTRSVKNKGSTESLRPKDNGSDPNVSHDAEDTAEIRSDPCEVPAFNPSSPRPNSAAADARSPIMKTPPPSKTGGALARQSSQSAQSKAHGPKIKKYRTASLASGESIAPKYRTRSMIIVWYDGAVQRAFENMVTLVSASRAVMRKGKMNNKMMEMKRAAEMELDEDDEDDNDEAFSGGMVTSTHDPLEPHKIDGIDKQAPIIPSNGEMTARIDGANDTDRIAPLLTYVSTRQAGPAQENHKPNNFGSTMSTKTLKGYKRSGRAAPDIFDVIDKSLEWIQAQCEHAASHVLRDPDCNTEIANIKSRLAEVKSEAEAEIERLKANGAGKRFLATTEPKGRQLTSPVRRRDFKPPSEIDADEMAVDEMAVDEGVEDLEPPKLIFKRSRDNHR